MHFHLPRIRALLLLPALLAPLLAFAVPAAEAAAPTTVWLDGGLLTVKSPAGQHSALTIAGRQGPAGPIVDVSDPANFLSAQFPCASSDNGHRVSCLASQVFGLRVDTGDGNDTVNNRIGDIADGRSRFTTILAGAGNDTVRDGPTNANIDAGPGNDAVTPGFGSDVVIGGTGVDVANYSDHNLPVTVKLDGLGFDGANQEFDDIANDVENLAATFFADVLIGNDADNQLSGGGGDDILRGGAGTDTANGGAGVDTCEAEVLIGCP